MKRRKPPVGGSGDSTHRSYHNITEDASLKALTHQITCALVWLQENKRSGPGRQAILLALGGMLLQYFQIQAYQS